MKKNIIALLILIFSVTLTAQKKKEMSTIKDKNKNNLQKTEYQPHGKGVFRAHDGVYQFFDLNYKKVWEVENKLFKYNAMCYSTYFYNKSGIYIVVVKTSVKRDYYLTKIDWNGNIKEIKVELPNMIGAIASPFIAGENFYLLMQSVHSSIKDTKIYRYDLKNIFIQNDVLGSMNLINKGNWTVNSSEKELAFSNVYYTDSHGKDFCSRNDAVKITKKIVRTDFNFKIIEESSSERKIKENIDKSICIKLHEGLTCEILLENKNDWLKPKSTSGTYVSYTPCNEGSKIRDRRLVDVNTDNASIIFNIGGVEFDLNNQVKSMGGAKYGNLVPNGFLIHVPNHDSKFLFILGRSIVFEFDSENKLISYYNVSLMFSKVSVFSFKAFGHNEKFETEKSKSVFGEVDYSEIKKIYPEQFTYIVIGDKQYLIRDSFKEGVSTLYSIE